MDLYLNKEIIKKILLKNEMTQKDFAQMIEVDNSQFSKILLNKKPVKEEIINKICDLLDVTKEEICHKNDIQSDNDINLKKVYDIEKNFKWNDIYYKRLLMENGLTQKKLCKEIGRDTSNFSRYSKGLMIPRMETVFKIYNELENCSTKKLIGISEDELNKAIGKNIFGNKTNTVNSTLKDNNKECDTILSNYKEFTGQNVIENIGIINENILALASSLDKAIEEYKEDIYKIRKVNESLIERINELESKISKSDKKENKIKENIPVATIWNNTCSEKEMKSITETTVDKDTEESYKKKIYKLINYISKKSNLTINQVMHNNYTQFYKIYGFNLNLLKAESKAANNLEAIYTNELCREIFFNMVSDNALKIN